MEHQETIIYQLSIRNPWYRANLLIIFLATLGPLQEYRLATTRAPNSQGPQNPTKNLAYWVNLFPQLLSQNHIFRSENHLMVSTPLNFCGDPLTKGAPWISKFCQPSLQRRSQWDWSTLRFDMNSAHFPHLYWKDQ